MTGERVNKREVRTTRHQLAEAPFRRLAALVGMVGLNQGMVSNPTAPFGGMKHSEFGREGGRDGILEYLDTK